MRLWFQVILFGIAASSTGCSLTGEEINYRLGAAISRAKTLLADGKAEEANLLFASARAVDPRRVKHSVPPPSDLLGTNHARRPGCDRSTEARILLYLPDRLLDGLDIVSFDVHLGPGVYGSVQVTEAARVALGGRLTGGIGLHESRNFGAEVRLESEVNALPFGARAGSRTRAGTSGVQGDSTQTVGLNHPEDPRYQDYDDYWSVGASATFFLIGASFEIHPVQIADFFCGWVGVDLLADDFAHTRNLQLDYADQRLISDLRKVAHSPATLARYEDFIRRVPGTHDEEQPATPRPSTGNTTGP